MYVASVATATPRASRFDSLLHAKGDLFFRALLEVETALKLSAMRASFGMPKTAYSGCALWQSASETAP